MVLKIKDKVRKKIKAYCTSIGNTEIGGFLLGKKIKEHILIEDIIILKQTKNNAHFELDNETLMDFTKNTDDRTLGSIIGWWHWHHRMMADWSSDDDQCFDRLANLFKVCVGVVAAYGKKGEKDLEEKWKVVIKTNEVYLSIDDIIPEIKHQSYIVDFKAVKKDIKDKVIEDNFISIECPRCQGLGFIREKSNHKKKYKYPYVYFEDDTRYNDAYSELNDDQAWLNSYIN